MLSDYIAFGRMLNTLFQIVRLLNLYSSIGSLHSNDVWCYARMLSIYLINNSGLRNPVSKVTVGFAMVRLGRDGYFNHINQQSTFLLLKIEEAFSYPSPL